MNKKKFAVTLILPLLLFGCVTPYQQKGFMGGYSDTQLDSNTVRVSFYGNAFTSRENVENNMLRRCAEVTIQRGYDYFIIISGYTTPTYGSYTSPGTYQQYTNTNVNVIGNTGYASSTTYGTYQPGQTINFRKFESTVVIKMFNGEKPFSAYNAREILGNLQS